MNYINQYYRQIQTNEVIVGEKIRKVYTKLIFDLTDEASEFEFSQSKAEHVINFIEKYCKHSKGVLGGRPFLLELWQKAMLSALFGFVHKIDNTRKYRELLFMVARKNGKSVLGSAIALYMLMADGENGPEIVSAATKKDQAKIIWLEAKKMVKKSPVLSKRIRPLVGELICDGNDGSFKPLSSESSTLDGLNVHCSFIDELHAIEYMNLYDVIVDGMIAREQPLSIITTTAGTVREGIFDLKYDEAERIINGYFDPGGYKDERILPIIYELDNRKEWMETSCFQKANPGIGTIKNLDMLQEKVNKAKNNPLLVKNLVCKDFNVKETSSEAWLTFEQLNNTDDFSIEILKPRYGIGGLDLSTTTDLTCASVIFKVKNDEKLYVIQMYWLPLDLLEQRTKEDKIPYDIWYTQGFLRVSEGNKINYKDVTNWFLEVQNELDIYIYKIGYDSWNSQYIVDELKQSFGKESTEAVIQGKKTMSAPMKTFAADLTAKKINYGNNPILKWNLANAAIDVDRNDNIQLMKTSNSRRRIDGVASLLDAYIALDRNYENYINLI